MGIIQDFKQRQEELERRVESLRQSQMQGHGTQFSTSEYSLYAPPRTIIKPQGGGGAGWNPDVWKPVFGQIEITGQDQNLTINALSAVENCVMMAGRGVYDFGTLRPLPAEGSTTAVQYLSGCVYAIISHPVWATEYFSLSCALSCTNAVGDLMIYSDDFTYLPLYYVNADGSIRTDYRGLPSITMYN